MSIASKLAAGLLAAACVGMVSAEEEVILKIEKPENFIQFKSVSASDDGFVIKGRFIQLLSKTDITVDPAKKYRVSGEFCLKGGKKPWLYLGFAPYDEKGRPILPSQVNGNNKTLTTVAADAKKGDKVIKVKDASKWNVKSPHSFVAVGAAEDYSDMPNRNLLRSVKPNAEQKGEVWELVLKEPLKADIPAGTAVRQQFAGASFIYTAGGFKPDDSWKSHAGVTSGFAVGTDASKFWKGTVKVKLLVMSLDGDKDSVTRMRNIKVTEVK